MPETKIQPARRCAGPPFFVRIGTNIESSAAEPPATWMARIVFSMGRVLRNDRGPRMCRTSRLATVTSGTWVARDFLARMTHARGKLAEPRGVRHLAGGGAAGDRADCVGSPRGAA